MDALDHLIWTALTGEQSRFALGEATGGGGARRFDPAIGPLAAIRDRTPASLADLAALVRETGPLALMQPGAPPALPGVRIARAAQGVQMVFAPAPEDLAALERARDDPRLVALGVEDHPAMLALALATEPGPFAARTGELGRFWGVKEQGRLLAMAGQRLRTASHVEVSAVCVDPAARGRGLAALLSRRAIAAIREAGRTPVLHSYADNRAALSLYARLGFVERTRVTLTVYVPEDWAPE